MKQDGVLRVTGRPPEKNWTESPKMPGVRSSSPVMLETYSPQRPQCVSLSQLIGSGCGGMVLAKVLRSTMESMDMEASESYSFVTFIHTPHC